MPLKRAENATICFVWLIFIMIYRRDSLTRPSQELSTEAAQNESRMIHIPVEKSSLLIQLSRTEIFHADDGAAPAAWIRARLKDLERQCGLAKLGGHFHRRRFAEHTLRLPREVLAESSPPLEVVEAARFAMRE